MSELVNSFTLEPHCLLYAATLNHPSLHKEHVIEVEGLVPCLNVPESYVSVIDVWLFSLQLLFVILVLQFGHLGVDPPNLLLVDRRISLVVLHFLFQH